MRTNIETSLKKSTVPELRSKGFKGSLPHFYRDRNDHIDLLTFQFNLHEGKFCVEISFADRNRTNVYIYKDTEVPKLRANQTTRRLRLGSNPEAGIKDHWFDFSRAEDLSDEIARDVVTLISSQAEPWWQRHTANEG